MKTNWPIKKLGEVITLFYGKGIPEGERDKNGKNPIYGANGELGRTNKFLVEGEAIIVGRKGSAGEVTRVSGKFWPSDVTYYVFGNKGVDIDFLFYLFKNINLKRFAKGIKPGINRNDVYQIEIPVPGIEEQRRIVKKLEKILAKIDQAYSLRQESAENTENIFISFINQLLENKKWTNKKMEDICIKVTDGTHDTPKYHSSGIPLITSKNLLPSGLSFQNIQFISKEDHNQIIKRSHAEKGDVLFAMIGTIGNATIIEDSKEFSIKNVGLFKTGGDFILGKLLRYLLNSRLVMNRLISGSQGANQKFVSLGQLRNLEVPYTENGKEQEKIVEYLDGLSEKVQALQKLQQEQLQDLEALQQSVLHQAFQGEL